MAELFRQLRAVLRPEARRSLCWAAFGTVLIALADGLAVGLVFPLVSLATGDGGSSGVVQRISGWLGDPSEPALTVVLTVAVVVLFVVKDIGTLAFNWWSSGFIFTERVRLSARILDRMLSAPYSEIAGRSSAELMRTADTAVMQVFNYTISGLVVMVSSGISIIVILIALMALAPLSTSVIIVYFALAALLFDRLAKPRARAAGNQMADSSLRGFRTAFAALGAAKELQLRGTQNHFVGRFEDAQLDGAYAGRTAAFISALPKYLLEILFIVAVAIVLLLGSTTSSGQPIGLLALYVAAGFRLLPSVSTLLGNASNIRVGAEPLRLVHAEVEAAEAQQVTQGREPGPPIVFESAIELESVSFSYPGSSRSALTDVNLVIPKGSTIALVGGSGAGKTTLADAILGLHRPTSGRVLADGISISSNLRSWQRRISYVAQDVFLLEASVAENIAFDQPVTEIDRDEVDRAVRAAQLEGTVRGLGSGIDTEVGERGARLSGGQRQRIGIARALYRRCDVLVLDEATSALDNQTEHLIANSMAALKGSVTLIMIAHRLSTIRDADQVVFMSEGGVRAVGTFEELTSADEEFARLVRLGSLERGAAPQSPPTGQREG